jgi:hypothetical protein
MIRTLVLALALLPGGRETRRADVVVYAATAAGAIAAVEAAREGRSVLLLEPGRHVGGMVSGGLGATDFGNRAAIGGTSREFFARVRDAYVAKYGAASPQVKDSLDGFRFEPHVAGRIFAEMLREAKVEVLFGRRLAGVKKARARIESITVEGGDSFEASVFIDASYEGDLLARAGVSYAVGREGRDEHGESIAGVQARSPAHQWPVPVPATRDDKKGLLPCVQPDGPGKPGAADRKVQAYNFRLCMTNVPENRLPWPKPSSYDPARYELLARYLERRPGLRMGQLMNPVRMPNGKTDTNNNGPFSTDHIGANWDYPDGDPPTRARIRQDHVEYTQGFLWFLAHDPRVPEPLRKEMNEWGLAKDEFVDTGNWPHQLYVREARRMAGAYFMTQADIMDRREKEDSVGLGSYNTDSHHVQRILDDQGNALNEGDFQVRVLPYAIPYRSLTPKAEQCENLLVPVCCSASHVAYGTIRMEPVYMILGQASGAAASLAVEGRVPVQKVEVAALQAKLRARKAVLSPAEIGAGAAAAPAGSRIETSVLEGIVVDDAQAARTGEWTASTSTGAFVGEGYLHDGNAEKGKRRVRFTPRLPSPGRYDVYLFYSPHPNRAVNVPVAVQTAAGERVATVNQRLPLAGGKPLRLGTYDLGADSWVEVRTEGTDGYVIADAVQFVPAK